MKDGEGTPEGGSTTVTPPTGTLLTDDDKSTASTSGSTTVADDTTKSTTADDQKTGDDKKVDDSKKVEEPPAKTVVPEKYDLKLPDGLDHDPKLTERTSAIARELGLSNEHGQKVLDLLGSEIAARDAATLAAHKPGGAEWVRQVEEWETATKADPEIGGDKLEATVAVAKQTMKKFFPESIRTFLQETGFGSHPDIIRAMHRIAKAMGEDKLVTASSEGGKESLAHKFYGATTPTTSKE